jgi:uncharacterized phiE125 gp8 family phage protein
MGIKVITPPTGEPIGRVDCQRHLRLDGCFDSPPYAHPEDALIEGYLGAAREFAELYTRRALATQTLELALDAFPSAAIELPGGTIQSITSVSYVDIDGTAQTIDTANFVLDDYSEPAWLLPADGFTWPSTQSVVNAVKVRFVAGYSIADDSPQTYPLPKSIRAALLLMLGHLYENREDTTAGVKVEQIPTGSLALLNPHRLSVGL